MTYKELYNQVLHLGFETTALEIDAAYVDAVNRAIHQVNALRPRIGYTDILHFPQTDQLGGRFKKLTEVVKGSVTFPVEGCKEFVVNISGNCEIVKTDNAGNKDTESFNGSTTTLTQKKVNLNNVTKITLQTNSRFIYENAAAYLAPHSGGVSTPIPGTHYTAYSITGATALCNPPISKAEGYEYITDGYRVEDAMLLIRNELSGVYRIAYYARPTEITLDNCKSITDSILLDDDLCELLPLVVASYVWLEDDPDRAQLYYTRYTEQAKMILAKGRVQAPIKYVTNGW